MSIFDAGYPFATAYLKGEEAHLVTPEHIARLLRVGDVPEAVQVLRNTDIGDFLGGYLIKTFDEMDERLWRYLDTSVRRLKSFELFPPDMAELSDVYMVKYDVLNIKAALRAVASGKKSRLIPLGLAHELGLLDELGKATDTGGVVSLLNLSNLSTYSAIVTEYGAAEDIPAQLLTQAKMDREYHASLLRVARRLPDSAALAQVIGTMIDMTSLKLIFRAASDGLGLRSAEYTLGDGYLISTSDVNQMLTLKPRDLPERLPYSYRKIALEVATSLERTKSVTVIDEIIDGAKFRLLREFLSPRLLSPLVLVWYLILKEAEIRDLRIIFKFLFDRRSLEEIKGYLVMSS